ncbi:MAG TPA: SRPBCC domain-containing protein [Flavisolibacter sp.]|jgi:uncharacterized protein YndB with AHSA1/START domain|nr:SRPBCC domain-containing protein [Flavisolibacter sp.]
MEQRPANSEPIVKEVMLDATPEKVWKAITDKDEMKKWYFDLKEFKAVPGFEFEFEGGPDDRIYIHQCRVIEVIPLKKLSYTWSYQGYQGTTLVGFELFEEGQRTRLQLTHEGLESFEVNNNPDLDKKNFDAGWSHIIGTSIKEYIDKNIA